MFAHGVEVSQHAAAIREELLAVSGQDEHPSYAIKQPEPQLLLKIGDLSRKCRLSNMQVHGGFRYRA